MYCLLLPPPLLNTLALLLNLVTAPTTKWRRVGFLWLGVETDPIRISHMMNYGGFISFHLSLEVGNFLEILAVQPTCQ